MTIIISASTRTLAVAALTLLALMGCSAPTEPPPTPSVGTEITVTGGTIQGLVSETDDLKQYHGIPFAAPPTDELRWAPPAAVQPWQGMRAASEPGRACRQPVQEATSFYGGGEPFEQGEDCLTLNVWTRAATADEKLPVMVWVHGGGLMFGSGAGYTGETLTAKGVVLVTVNYRLGPFGFFAHPELSAEHPNGVSGNQGIRDQVAALHWVQDNINRFGGDPNNVTVFGESAGSLSMSLLQATPLAEGLFQRLIAQSGGAFQPMWFRDRATSYAPTAESLGADFAAAIAAEGEVADASLAAIRAASTETVMAAFNADPRFSNYDSFAIVDGEVIPDEVANIFANGRQVDVPVLIGSNADEGTAFIEYFTPGFGEGAAGLNAYSSATLAEADDTLSLLYPAADGAEAEESWGHLFADQLFTYPMRAWARSMETVDSPAYLYWFTWQPPVPEQEKYRSFHAAEIAYVFGSLEAFNATPTEADRTFSNAVSDLWVRFATTGNPNGAGIPEWPAFSRSNEAYMELGPEIRAGQNLKLAQMSLIENAWAIRRNKPSSASEPEETATAGK